MRGCATPLVILPLWLLGRECETPRTIDQLEKQARLVKDLLRRSSQSPSSCAVGQLVKGCQLAMHSATLLIKENIELRAANQRRQRKQQQRRQYIARGGALQAEQGQLLAIQAEMQRGRQLNRRLSPRANAHHQRVQNAISKAITGLNAGLS